ncbi:MAG: hypothetical protein V8R82_09890 [Clostridia bacterium]
MTYQAIYCYYKNTKTIASSSNNKDKPSKAILEVIPKISKITNATAITIGVSKP